jgi:DNA polymerase-3 subunit gamma/tau
MSAAGSAAAVSPTAPSATQLSNTTAGATALAVDQGLARFAAFETVVELIRVHRDVKLLVDVENGVRLISYQPGRITFAPTPNAPADLAQKLGSRLQAWTGNRWAISIEAEGGAETIAEKRDAADLALKAEASAHPLVQAVFEAFPNAKIVNIKTMEDIETTVASEALAEVEDEWDPFDED